MNKDHVIYRQILEIDFPSKKEALDGQERFNQIYMNDLLPVIDSLFSDISGSDRIRVDKLEVDLGELSLLHLDEEVMQKLETKLRDELYNHLQITHQREAATGVRTSAEKRNEASVSKQNNNPLQNDRIEDFRFFIENGRLPWWSAGESPSEMAATLMKENQNSFLTLVLSLIPSENSRRRLIYQLSNETLLEILQKGSTSPSIPETVLSLLKDLLKLHRKKQILPLSRSNFRLFFWESAFDVWLPSATGSSNSPINLAYSAKETPLAASIQMSNPEQLFLTYFLYRINRRKGLSTSSLKEKRSGKFSFEQTINRLQKRIKREGLTNSPLSKTLSSIPLHSSSEADIIRAVSPVDLENPEAKNSAPANKTELPREAGQPSLKTGESIEINNAGLVILAQFLPLFFDALGLIKDKAFATEESAGRAALLLQYVITGETALPEHELTLNKLLCGLDPDVPLPGFIHISKHETEEVNNLLESVVEHWKALKGTSARGLRQTFLNRPGILTKDVNGWSVYVERTTVDVLLDHLPWSISIIKLPWNDNLIYVEW